MSPLLGALGDSSEYAYRGSLDDVPVDFSFTNITGAEPGIAYTSGPVTITGLNNKIQVAVSTGASIAVNSGIFTGGPAFIRSGDTISIYTPTTQGADSDFSKTYRTTVTLGGRISKDWFVTTRSKDSDPATFSFINTSNQELGITSTSNTITISGLEPTVSSNAAITSGIGSFSKNGGAPGTATTVANGDTIAIVLRGPTDYSKTNTTELTVGNYATTYSVSTRNADTTVDQFVFNNYTNVAISSAFDSNSITLSGADNNTAAAPVPLTATVTGGFLKVQRDSSVVRDFSANSATVYNGDVLTLRLNSSPSYSTTTSASLSITGVNTPVGIASTFSVTTRPIVSDTIVDNFQLVDKDNQNRNVQVISDPITISGITTHADDFAHIYLTNNGDGAQFRIRRGGVVVRDFASTDAGVRNGDLVDLRITTSPASEGTVLTNVNIAGTDNTDINNIITQTRTDTWVVKSARRNCPLSLPTFQTVTGVEPGTLQSVTFTPTSYDSDCGVVVNTSNANSYLNVNGVTGNNLLVLPGIACTVFMTAGTFSENRTTTIRLTANNNLPTPNSTTANWTVTTRASSDPTVTLSASPSILNCGGQSLLTWSSTNAISVTTQGFTGVGTQGSIVVNPSTNTNYSITATGPDNTTRTATAGVVVQSTATATLQASSTNVEYNGSTTLSWSSSNSSSVVSNFGVTAPSGSRTFNNLKNSTTYTVRAVSNSGCPDSPTASVTVNVESCTEDTQVDSLDNGVDLNYTYANPGNGFNYYFTSVSGFNVNSPARETGTSTSSFQDVASGSGLPAGQCGSQTNSCVGNSVPSSTKSWTVPSGVTSVTITLGGAGGGGAGGGGAYPGGSGGDGGEGSRVWPVSAGNRILYAIGPGGQGSPPCGAGNIDAGGVSGGPGWSSWAWYNDTGTLIGWAEGGGGGGRGSWRGSVDGTDGRAALEPGVILQGGGASGGAGGPQGSDPCVYQSYLVGQPGQPGYIIIEYSVAVESATWGTLINEINSQHRISFNRPASVSEMDNWVSQYVNSNISIATLKSRISTSGAFRSSTGAISFCGTRL